MTPANNDPVLEAFGTLENARKTAAMIHHFSNSYAKHMQSMSLDVWLTQEFKAFPAVWKNDTELQQTVAEITSTIVDVHAKQASLMAHLSTGRSQETWLAQQLEQSAKAAGEQDVTAYVVRIDDGISVANQQVLLRLPAEVIAQLPPSGGVQTYQPATPQQRWNDITRISLVKKLAQKMLANTALQGVAMAQRNLSQQMWDTLLSPQMSGNKLLTDFYNRPLNDLPDNSMAWTHGMSAGAMEMARRQGFVPGLRDMSPADMTYQTYAGMEAGRALNHYGQGKISVTETFQHIMRNKLAYIASKTSTIGKYAGMLKGAVTGFAVGGPIGMAVGVFVGNVTGELAGDLTGQVIRKAGSQLVDASIRTLKSMATTVATAAKTAVTKTVDSVKSIFSW